MGSLYKGVCYPTSEAAKKAICSDAGQLVLGDGQMHASACISTDFSLPAFDVITSTDASVNALRTYQYPAFLECDHTYTADLSLLWMSAALLLFSMLFGLKHLYNLFSGRYDE